MDLTKIDNCLASLDENVVSEHVRYNLPGIRYMLISYRESCEKAISEFDKGGHSYYAFVRDCNDTYGFLNNYCSQLAEDLAGEAVEQYYGWEEMRVDWMWLNIWLIVGIVLTLLGITLFIREGVETEKQLIVEQQKSEKYAILLKEANFMAMQSQINPHFLFNTLNSIKSTVMLGKTKQTFMMIDSFAAFLRYNLKDREPQVKLTEELSITEEYIRIQQFRFEEHIKMRIIYDADLTEQILVPKFSIQPLVENAIIHGLENKVGDGLLIIDVKKGSNYIYVRVFDNGDGIGEEKLNKIKTEENISEKGIGIGNIQSRLKIFYDRDDVFHIISRKEVGTLVVLQIPLEYKDVQAADSR
ncbi:MAG: histidine kinase [Pseudobutyrivibrio sp.]|nr:histidine kinase [Pseudobutyrivibrio sp.]